MLPIVAALVSIIVFGLPAVLALEPRARGGKLAGLAFFYGCGLVHFTLLGLSLAGVPWTLLSVQCALILEAALIAVAWRKRAAIASEVATVRAAPSLAARAIDLVTIVTVATYAAYSISVRIWQWDFWSIWGLKGRVFFEARAIDWRFLENPANAFSHGDYPLLLPLQFEYLSLFAGHWDDRWSGLLAAAFVAAMLLVLRPMFARTMSPLLAAAATLAATAFAVTPFVGLADGPLIALIGTALLLLQRGLSGEPVELTHAALLLGLASLTKNEGLSMLVAVLIAVAFLHGFRSAKRLWPALAVTLPWLMLRATHVLPTDVVSGPLLARIERHLAEFPLLMRLLVTKAVEPWIFLLVLLALASVGWAVLRGVRVILAATLLQALFYVGAYLSSPHPIAWHVTTSWPRISAHLAMPLLLAAMLTLAERIEVEEDAGHAEAGPGL
jgi:hypothetical protein